MDTRSRWLILVALVTLSLVGAPAPSAAADDVYVPDADMATALKAEEAKKDGWDLRATVGASLSFGDNRKVVGQPDGASWLIGMTFSGEANLVQGRHEWRNSLGFKESFSRTPVIPEFVKAADELKIESLYIFRVVPPWLGAFARAAFETAIMQGKDVRPEPVDYVIPGRDGVFTKDRLKLTDPFLPFKLKESLGMVYTPIAKEEVTFETRLGFGGRHTFAADQLVLADDETTPQIEIGALETNHQGGGELTATLWGTLSNKLVSYKLSAEAMTPFLHSSLPAGDDRSALDLTNVEILAKLSFKLVSWASLDYEFKALREPQLVDEWQIINGLLLTFSYSVSHTTK